MFRIICSDLRGQLDEMAGQHSILQRDADLQIQSGANALTLLLNRQQEVCMLGDVWCMNIGNQTMHVLCQVDAENQRLCLALNESEKCLERMETESRSEVCLKNPVTINYIGII